MQEKKSRSFKRTGIDISDIVLFLVGIGTAHTSHAHTPLPLCISDNVLRPHIHNSVEVYSQDVHVGPTVGLEDNH